MTTFRVTYARTVVMSYNFEAEDQAAAEDIAWHLEQSGKLGLDLVQAGDLPANEFVWIEKRDNTIDNIEDDDSTWIVEEVS